MGREFLQGFLRLGLWVGVTGLVMVFLQEPGSAGFVLSVCSAAIGLALVVGAIVALRADYPGWLARLAARRSPPPEDEDTSGGPQ